MTGYLVDSPRNASEELTNIITMVLQSPIKEDTVVRKADGKTSMEVLSGSNTDVRTRIVVQMAYNACKGDTKAATWLMTYGGFVPGSDKETVLDGPQIIDDITNRTEPVPPSRLALLNDEE